MELEVVKFAKLKHEISKATKVTQLRSLREQFQRLIQDVEQMHSMHSSYHIVECNFYINEMHDALIQKTIHLTEMNMVGVGLGAPPTSYSYLLLGSGGRSEQTLASDQDSALIYEDTRNSDEVKSYYLAFADQIVNSLIELGYPPCQGKVQSNELMWCQSELEWKNKLDAWFTDATWESIRYLLIFADARCIYGDDLLFYNARSCYMDGLSRYTTILERMIENTVQYKMLVGVFGQFITDRYGDHVGSMDIKYGGYIPIVNSIRWLALNGRITKTSTLLRIDELLEKEVISVSEHMQYREAFLQMLSLRLRAGYRKEQEYFEGYGKLNPKTLDAEEIRQLKKSLKIGKELQKHVLRKFGRIK